MHTTDDVCWTPHPTVRVHGALGPLAVAGMAPMLTAARGPAPGRYASGP